MRDKEKLKKISKLICKHPSEWNTWKNISIFEDEVKAIYKKGIDQEEDPDKKQELEKARDAKLELLKEKIEQLSILPTLIKTTLS